MKNIERRLPLVGRLLICLIFVISGVGKIIGFASTTAYIASKGLPLPQVAALMAIIVELGGSAMLIFDWKIRWAAAGMIVYAIATAILFHDFWAVAPAQFTGQMNNFLKNIAMSGGLLYVMVFGSGRGFSSARHGAD